MTRRTAENTAEYAEFVREVGKDLNLPVIDLWQAFMDEAGYKKGDIFPGSKLIGQNPVLVRLMHDGLHFNPDGYKILFREFMSFVRTSLPHLAPERLPLVHPLWDNAAAFV